MLKLFRKDLLTPQTERIYKVPLCIQDTIPIYRISENGIFELESPTNKDGGKKKIHQFDRMYLFEDINFSTQDEEEKEETGKRRQPSAGGPAPSGRFRAGTDMETGRRWPKRDGRTDR